MTFDATCDVDYRFRAVDSFSAVSIFESIFLLSKHECCIRKKRGGSVSTVLSCSEDDELTHLFSVKHFVWVVSRRGHFSVIDAATEELLVSEHTQLRVHYAVPTLDGLAVVFDNSLSEVALLVVQGGSLAVVKTLHSEHDVTCAFFGPSGSIVCAEQEVAIRDRLGLPSVVDISGACFCYFTDDDDAWVGCLDGSVSIVRAGCVISTHSPHTSRVISIASQIDGTVWSFDMSGIAVVWCASEKVPRGSFRLSNGLSSVSVCPSVVNTPLLGVHNGEVIQWRLATEALRTDRESESTRFLRHLCDILCASEDEVGATSDVEASVAPTKFSHPALPYLAEAVRSLTETRAVLGAAFSSFGFVNEGLRGDIEFLVSKYKALLASSNQACLRLRQHFGLVGLECGPQDIADLVESVIDQNAQAEHRCNYVLDRHIETLNADLTRKDLRIEQLTEELQRLRDTSNTLKSQYASAVQDLEFQVSSVQSLEEKLAGLKGRILKLESDVLSREQDISNLQLSMTKRENSFVDTHAQLIQEVEDLTQNEVCLVARIREYQLLTTANRAAIKRCQRLLTNELPSSSSLEKISALLSSCLARVS